MISKFIFSTRKSKYALQRLLHANHLGIQTPRIQIPSIHFAKRKRSTLIEKGTNTSIDPNKLYSNIIVHIKNDEFSRAIQEIRHAHAAGTFLQEEHFLYILRNRDLMTPEKAIIVLKEMKKTGVRPGTETHFAMIKILFRHSPMKALEYIKNLEKDTQREFYTFLIKLCVMDKHLEDLEQILDEIGENATDVMYNIAINGFTEAKKIEGAWRLFEKMQKMGIQPDIVTYTTMVKGQLKIFDFSSAHNLEKEMSQKGLNTSTLFPLYASAYLETRDMESVEYYLKKMLESNAIIRLSLANRVIDAYFQLGNLAKVEEMFKYIKENLDPDHYTFRNLMNHYVTTGDMEKVEDIFLDMICFGFTPEAADLQILLNGFIEENQVDEAELIFETALKKGPKPDANCYSVIIRGLCDDGQVEKARHYFKIMLNMGIIPEARAFGSLIYAYFRELNIPEVKSLFEMMDNFGIEASPLLLRIKEVCFNNINEISETLNNRLNTLVEMGQLEKAEDLLNELISLQFKPNIIHYNTLLKGILKKDINQVDSYLEMLQSKGITPDVVTYNIIMREYVRKKQLEKASQLLDKLIKENFLEEMFFSIYIGGLLKQNLVEKAFEVFEELKKLNITPTHVIFRNFLFYCAEKFDIELLDRVLFEMAKLGVQPKLKILDACLGMLDKDGDKAFEFIERFRIARLHIETMVYNHIFTIYLQKGEIEKVRRVLDSMIENGPRPTTCNFRFLISIFCKEGRVEEALQLFDRMNKLFVLPCTRTLRYLIEACEKKNMNEQSVQLLKKLQQFDDLPNALRKVAIKKEVNEFYSTKEEMESVDEKIEEEPNLDLRKLSNALYVHITNGDLEQSINIFNQSDRFLNIIFFNILLKSLFKFGEEKVVEGIAFMKSKNVMPDVITYNTLMRGYINLHRYETVEKLYLEMKELGIQPNLSTHVARFWAFYYQHKFENAKQVIKELENDNFSPKFSLYIGLASIAFDENNWDQVNKYLQNAMETEIEEKDYIPFTNLLKKFALKGMSNEITEWISKMEERGLTLEKSVVSGILSNANKVRMNIINFNKKLNALVKEHKIEEALRGLELEENNSLVDVVSYNTVIKGLCKVDVERARQLMKKMEERNISPDVFTFSTICGAYLKFDQLEQCKQILEEMTLKNIQPNIYIYNIHLILLQKEGKLEEFDVILQKMKQANIDFVSVTFDVCIRGYMDRNDYEGSKQILKKMIDYGYLPPVESISHYIHSIMNNHIEKIVDCIQFLNENGITIPEEIMNTILLKLNDNTQIESLLKIDAMKPTSKTLNICLKKLCEFGELDNALTLMLRMKPDYDILPEFEMLSNLCEAMDNAGMYKGVLKIRSLMRNLNIPPTQKMKEIFKRRNEQALFYENIKTLIKDKKIEEMIKAIQSTSVELNESLFSFVLHQIVNYVEYIEIVMNEMEKRKIEMNELLLMVVTKAYLKHNQIDKAEQVVTKMIQKGNISKKVINTVLNDFVMRNYDEGVQRMIEMMNQQNLEADIYTHGIIMKHHLMKNNLEKAEEIFNLMLNNNLKPDIVIYATMIQGYIKNDQTDKANDLIRRMRKDGIQPDLLIYETIIEHNIAKDKFDQVYYFWDEMVNNNIEPSKKLLNICGPILELRKIEILNNASSNSLEEVSSSPLQKEISLLNVYLEENNIEKAEEIFKAMKEHDEHIEDALLRAFYKNSENREIIFNFLKQCIRENSIDKLILQFSQKTFLKEAHELWKYSIQNNFAVNTNVCSFLYSAFLKHDEMERAEEIFSHMMMNGNLETFHFTPFIEYYLNRNDFDKIFHILTKMVKHKVCDEIILLDIFKKLVQVSEFKYIETLFKFMYEQHVKIPLSMIKVELLTFLTKKICRYILKKSQIEAAFQLYLHSSALGIRFNAYTNNVLLNSLKDGNKIDTILNLTKGNLATDTNTFSILVKHYFDSGNVQRVEELLKEIENFDVELLQNLIEGFIKFDQLERVKEMIRIAKKNSLLDSKICNVVYEYLLKKDENDAKVFMNEFKTK